MMHRASQLFSHRPFEGKQSILLHDHQKPVAHAITLILFDLDSGALVREADLVHHHIEIGYVMVRF